MIHPVIFKELMKRGHSGMDGVRRWDISDSRLWYVTPELIKGFRGLEEYEPYRKNIFARELQLIQDHAQRITTQSHNGALNIIDLGCSRGIKAEAWLQTLSPELIGTLRYCPIDISSSFVDEATQRILSLEKGKVKEVRPLVSDFNDLDTTLALCRSADFQKHLILLLGSIISTSEITEFLYMVSQPLLKGDTLVIGNGLRVGERFVDLAKYQHPVFSKWFFGVMRGLDFNEDEVEYNARFANGRVEGYYKVLIDKMVRYQGREVAFKKDDEIIVAAQYKFYDYELEEICKLYFSSVELIKDKEGEYALIVCRK
ncbi:MAG TPA: L-histidine N(alpha)-methyltransferase [Candidatus Nanoarchaeia archaeon]|nr:L-histidine N(alpha)-methyltransferase [Candidatus Nanoarchaeia archaeon]